MPSPICTVNATSTTDGVDVTGGSTPTIALVSPASLWSLTCIGTDDLNSVATVNASLAINQTAKTATYAHPTSTNGVIFQSVIGVNALGYDGNNQLQSSYTTTFGVYTLTADSNRVIVMNEKFESSSQFGWMKKLNSLIRQFASAVNSIFTWNYGGRAGSQQTDVGNFFFTTDATPTTIATHLLPASTDAKYIILVKVRETSGGASRRACFWKSDDFERIGGAAPTRSLSNGANVDLGSDANGTPWTLTIKVSANTVIAEFVGQAATNITGTLHLQIIQNA